jgi:hypothetical protein
MKNERRVKIVLVSERLLLSLFQGSGECVAIRLDHPQLPSDAEVVRVSHDFDRMAFRLMVQSESFDPVPAGAMAPYFDEGHDLAECHLRYIDGDRVTEERPLSQKMKLADVEADLFRAGYRSPIVIANEAAFRQKCEAEGITEVRDLTPEERTANQSSREWFQREMSRTD